MARKRKTTWISRLAGIVLGLALVAIWLAVWRLARGPAILYPGATILVGLAALMFSMWRPFKQNPTLRTGLRTVWWIMAVLTVASALSIGGFLPPSVAEWVAPVLGRFGGAPAILLIGVGVAIYALFGEKRRTGLAVDALIACSLTALWIATETGRQADFPPPPTAAALPEARLDALFALSLALLGAYLGLAILGRLGVKISIQPLLLRWAGLLALAGLAFSMVFGDPGWYRFALAAALTLAVALGAGSLRQAEVDADGETMKPATPLRAFLGTLGWFAVAVSAVLLLYATISEDLEVVLLRNTLERQVIQFWRSVAGDERQQARPTGAIEGQVLTDVASAIPGAKVVLSEVNGQVYSATTGLDGRYRLEGVSEGDYLPLAVAPGYGQGRAFRTFPPGRAVAVRGGQTATAEFRLVPTEQAEIGTGTELTFGEQTTASVENPEPSRALRREFSYTRGDTTLSGGLVHEPPAEMGPGPFPILLLIFPGPANAWEGISIPLASKGYVVVSYFPVRLLDLEGDVDDLMLLFKLTADGRMSERGDRNSIALVGGSVSTVYTYLMAGEIQGSDTRSKVRALIQYGGLFDFFQFRKDWEEGKVIIDPGLSDLEYLLVAFGRPDTRPEIYSRLSPRFALGPGTLPPTLFVHTGNDIVVPPNQSAIADATLKEWGITSQYLFYPDSEHYLDTSKPDPTQVDMLNRTLAFLDLHMK
jgi:hypothetical protein